jgi:hypothetical protein
MGFFDRFSKSFLGKKDAEDTTSAEDRYATLSLSSPSEVMSSTEVNAEDSVQLSSVRVDTAVAVAEVPENTDSISPWSGENLFDTDFDQDLEDVFATLENQEALQQVPAEEMRAEDQAVIEEMRAEDQAVIENLFADIAANYARPIKNFMFELKRGTATKDWVEICRPAMQGITRSADGMGLRVAAQRMVDFEAALALAEGSEQRILSGELRDLLLWCYEDLVKVMPQAFMIGEEEQQREGIIIHSLLKQIPDVGLITIEKLYRAALTSLDTLYLARKDDLAVATGISVDLSESICLKFKAYRVGLEGNLRDVGEGQRKRLGEMVADLRRQHEGFVYASENEWTNPSLAADKRDFRQQRQTNVLWINVLLAEIGELELVNELQKMSFERKVQRLEQYLSSPSATA